MPSEQTTQLDVAIVGAGLCGVALAAALARYGARTFRVLEQGRRAGSFWEGNYDRIRLHTPWHGLPADGGLGRDYPMYKSRDELLRYLGDYCELHALGPRIGFGEKVLRIAHRDPTEAGPHEWSIETSQGRYVSRFAAVCTSYQRVPYVPPIADHELFKGEALHTREFKNGRPFAGKNVLVVGSGNSACEVAVDLVENDAERVDLLVRGPRYFVSLDRMTEMYERLAPSGRVGPEAVRRGHRVTMGTEAFTQAMAERDERMEDFIVDMSDWGIDRPEASFSFETFVRRRVAVFDVGAIDLIRSGRIGVVKGDLEAFTRRGVRLGDGQERAYDAVLLGTGFRHGLEEFLTDHETLLAPRPPLPDPHPLTDMRCRSTLRPSLFFVGFDTTLFGGQSYGHWGWEVGEKIATALRSANRIAPKIAASARSRAVR